MRSLRRLEKQVADHALPSTGDDKDGFRQPAATANKRPQQAATKAPVERGADLKSVGYDNLTQLDTHCEAIATS